MKIVPVQHRNGGYTYVFSTPEDLHDGDIVLCQTKKGTDLGVCKSDSFEAEGKVLEYILSQSGTSVENVKPVLGVYQYSEFKELPELDIPRGTPIDSPILVWDDQYPDNKYERHFAGIDKNGKILAWTMGGTSWTAGGDVKIWDHAELVKEDNK